MLSNRSLYLPPLLYILQCFFGGGGDWTLRSWDLTLAVLRPQVKLSILDLSAMLAGLHQAESTAPTS